MGPGTDSALPFPPSSTPACVCRDLKTTISFYLVLFYATLIMLSRQVSPRSARCVPRSAELNCPSLLGGDGRGAWAASTLGHSPEGRPAPGPHRAHWGPPCGRPQIDYYCRLDCLWKKKFRKEREEFETMESVNRLLLENVLPAHVAAHFVGDKLDEVWCPAGPPKGGGVVHSHRTQSFPWVWASPCAR